MPQPGDGHVHTEWSWDAAGGSMERTCAQARQIGLPAVAFTEHLDHTPWTVVEGELDGVEHLEQFITPDGRLVPPAFDADGYLESVQRCREQFPDLRILSGVEVGEPHRHRDVVATVLAAGTFDRVLGSLHCLPFGTGFSEPPNMYRAKAAAEVMRDYLAEIPLLVSGSDQFAVLAHIDYAVRSWPEQEGPFDPSAFEDELRHALAALAAGGRALEVNTSGAVHPQIVRWWRDEGGQAIAFGSDAHEPTALARGFAEAVALVESHGFRPGRHPDDFWTRSG